MYHLHRSQRKTKFHSSVKISVSLGTLEQLFKNYEVTSYMKSDSDHMKLSHLGFARCLPPFIHVRIATAIVR